MTLRILVWQVDWAAEAVRAQEVLEACKQIFPRCVQSSTLRL